MDIFSSPKIKKELMRLLELVGIINEETDYDLTFEYSGAVGCVEIALYRHGFKFGKNLNRREVILDISFRSGRADALNEISIAKRKLISLQLKSPEVFRLVRRKPKSPFCAGVCLHGRKQ